MCNFVKANGVQCGLAKNKAHCHIAAHREAVMATPSIVAEPIIEAVTEPIVEAVIEPIAEAVIEPVIEPVIEDPINDFVTAISKPVILPVINPGIIPSSINEVEAWIKSESKKILLAYHYIDEDGGMVYSAVGDKHRKAMLEAADRIRLSLGGKIDLIKDQKKVGTNDIETSDKKTMSPKSDISEQLPNDEIVGSSILEEEIKTPRLKELGHWLFLITRVHEGGWCNDSVKEAANLVLSNAQIAELKKYLDTAYANRKDDLRRYHLSIKRFAEKMKQKRIEAEEKVALEAYFNNNDSFFDEIFEQGFPNPRGFLSIETDFTEIFDSNKLNFIVQNLDAIKSKYRPTARDSLSLDKYLLLSKDGKFQVKYKQKSAEALRGRYQAVRSLSGQCMVREARHTIFNDFYIDMDMDNCHPVITLWMCDRLSIKCDTLREYVSSREFRIREIMNANEGLTREAIKQVFLSINYGGSSGYESVENKTTFLKAFMDESASIKKAICDHFKYFKEESDQVRRANKKDYNYEGSALSHICYYVENQMLMRVFKYVESKAGNIQDSILCFDGIMIRKHKFKESYLADLERIFSNKGINMKFSVKPLKPLDLTEFGFDKNKTYTYVPINSDGDEAPEMSAEKVELYQSALKLLKSAFDDTTFIEYFLKVNRKYKSFDNVLYYFNGCYWVKGSEQYIIADIDSIYRDLYTMIQSHFQDEELIKALKKIICLRSVKYKETLIKGIIGYCRVEEDLWDLNDDLVGFKNGVYDLLTDSFRPGKYEDYVSMVIDYDYSESSSEELSNVHDYFKKIMPRQEERELLLLLLSTMLSGRHLEKFIVCTGSGRNGKDTTFTYLIKRTLGCYYYNCNPTAFTQKIKSDQNVSIANFDKKRVVVTSEPDKDETIKTAMVKSLTGANETSMRSLYSTKTKVNLNETLFMLCNDKPALDHSEQAMMERLIVIPFRSTFKSKQSMAENGLEEGENYVFEASEDVKSDAYLDRMKLPTFNFLTSYFRKFRDDGYLIQSIPDSIKKLNESYMEESDEFMNWFNSEYEKTGVKEDRLKLADVYHKFCISDFYLNLTKKEKRANNKGRFIEKVSSNVSLRIFFKERVDATVDGKQATFRNILTGFKEREDEDKKKKKKSDEDGGDDDDDSGVSGLENDIAAFVSASSSKDSSYIDLSNMCRRCHRTWNRTSGGPICDDCKEWY